MTACVNNQNEVKGGVSHKVLRSVVAGVLAVSMVPTTALAADAGSADVELLATSQDAWGAIKPTFNVKPGSDNAYTFDYTEKAVDFELVSLTTVDGTALKEGVDYTWCFYTDKSGTKTKTNDGSGAEEEGGAPSNPGTYYVGITECVNGAAQSNVFYQAFTIKSVALDEAVVYQVDGNDLKDVSDTSFIFTGNEITLAAGAAESGSDKDVSASDDGKLWIAIDGKPLKADDVKVTVEQSATIENVGTYKLKVEGETGSVYEGLTRYFDIEVKPFDLSQATVTIPDATQYASDSAVLTAAKVIWGEDTLSDEFAKKLGLTVTSFSGPGVSGIPSGYTDKGTYGVTLAVKSDESDQTLKKNIINSVSTNFVIANALAGYFEYAGTELAADGTTNGTPETALSVTEANPFLLSNIVVDKTDSSKAALLTRGKDYTVTVTKDGKTVSDYTQPGLYKVDVDIKVPSDYSIAGSRTFYFKVTKGQLEDATVFVSVDGHNVPDDTADSMGSYTGEAHKVSVVVKDSEGVELEKGVDYDFEITMDGEKVDSVVNAGEYAVKLTSDSYTFASDVDYSFTIDAAEITGIRVAGLVTVKSGSTVSVGLPYTGAEIVPTFEYTTADLSKVDLADDEVEWKTLPAEAYKATFQYDSSATKEVLKTGKYTVTLKNNTLSENAVVAANYDVAGSSVSVWGGTVDADGDAKTPDNTFSVIDAKVFEDVPVTEWYAESVAKAADLDYMNGYYGTKLFGPNDKITRAEAVCVLFNMAGGTIADNDPESDLADYAAKFSDVSKDAWYAQALGWAAKTKVVSGYADGTFGPDDKLTREQFAAMLANYAKAAGNYTAADASSIEDYSDAAEVSDWAAESVAWAVANEVMGNGSQLWPTATISRAEVATMAVNYQPEKLK